jgi:2-polyprenyl-6-methoxyphenol hydroxylase-like FAD-dependent oxidoreductase
MKLPGRQWHSNVRDEHRPQDKETIMRKILISGASIAGPATALSLLRYGFHVTVVERASTVRMGGYPIDLRGTAIQVAERMGLMASLRRAHINTKRMQFFDDDGRVLATIRPEDLTGGIVGFDVEVPRGTVAAVLFEATRHDADYRFNDAIAAIDQDAGGAHVTFQSGRTETFDLVIGADGLHSNTRAITFGPEAPFARYLGYTFAGFTMPHMPGLDQETACYFAENRFATLFAVRGFDRPFAFFVFRRPYPSDAEMIGVAGYRRTMHEAFKNDGWVIPEMLKELDVADDIFCDTVSQIRMPTWSSGRVARVGDAAYGPSFMTGQGTSMALVGAYILAGELASHADHSAAFASYEKAARKFIEDNQSLATPGGWQLIPNTAEEAMQRRLNFAAIQQRGAPDQRGLEKRSVHNSLKLPEYPAWQR